MMGYEVRRGKRRPPVCKGKQILHSLTSCCMGCRIGHPCTNVKKQHDTIEVYRSFHSDSRTPRTLFEGCFAAFENLAHLPPNVGIFQTTALIGYCRQGAGAMWAAFGDDDLVCVGIDDQVGIMRDNDNLTAGFGLSEASTNSSKIDFGSRFSSG